VRLKPAEKVRYQQQPKDEDAYTAKSARASPVHGIHSTFTRRLSQRHVHNKRPPEGGLSAALIEAGDDQATWSDHLALVSVRTWSCLFPLRLQPLVAARNVRKHITSPFDGSQDRADDYDSENE
jgi:hypothetical protein